MPRRLSAEHRAKIAAAGRGRKHSAETRAKMAESARKRWAAIPKKKRLEILAPSIASLRGRPSPMKGVVTKPWNELSYSRRHAIIAERYGPPTVCAHCGNEAHHWANVSQEYLEGRDDWLELCRSCHMKLDSSPDRKGAGLHARTARP